MAEISSTGDQMLQILEMVAFNGPISTAELAAESGINRTVVHRLLTTLHGRGYISRSGKGFVIGHKVLQLASTGALHDMLQLARPVMRTLADGCGETVVLHRIDADQAVVVEQTVNESQLIRVQHKEGSRHPLTLGASGRAILAYQPASLVRRLLLNAPEPEHIRQQLAVIQQGGVSLSENELQAGVVGVAVPIREADDLVRYAIGILVPSQRAERIPELTTALMTARQEIETSTASAEDNDPLARGREAASDSVLKRDVP